MVAAPAPPFPSAPSFLSLYTLHSPPHLTSPAVSTVNSSFSPQAANLPLPYPPFPFQAANFPFCTIEPNTGMVTVPDPRLQVLSNISKSKELVGSWVEGAGKPGSC